MIQLPPAFADRRSIRVLDALAVLWTCLWIGIGYWVYHAVQGLGSLSHTVVLSGHAVDAAASALQTLSHVPLVGGQFGSLVQSAHQAAQSAIYNGAASRGSIDTLARLLFAALALAPTTPLLVLYGMLRRGWRHDVRSLRAIAEEAGGDAQFEQFLARRALERLPYHRLRRVSPHPWRDYEEGNTSALAEAELARVGLRRELR